MHPTPIKFDQLFPSQGATHKREWDQFVRTAISKGKMPVALSDYCRTNKLDLFNMWLDSDKSWDKVKLQVERKTQGTDTTKKGWEAVQGKELRKRFDDEEKFKKLIASRKSAGMYYEDEDFPGDDDESKCAKYVWF